MKKTYIAIIAGLTVFGWGPGIKAQIQGPCALLTTAEVQQAFPGSKPGQLDRRNEKHGLLTCMWDTPKGLLSIITGEEVNQSPKDEAQGWTLTFLDPLRSDAERHVRYEVLTGVGDGAVAVVERQDKSKGFAQNGAILVVRRGKQQISVLSTELAHRERADALRIFAELGKAIAKRLN